MDKTEFFEYFKDVVYDTHTVVYYSSNELQVRCPYCGDSSKNPKSAHMYISNKYPHAYNCFRCPVSSGYLTYDLVDKLGIFDAEIRVYAKKLEKDSIGNYKPPNRKKVVKDLTLRRRLELSAPNKLDIDKVKYLTNRIGRKLSKRDIERYKIVFSLIDFLELNKNENYPAKVETVEYIDEEFFGFLSMDETNITFRNITQEKTKRYRLFSLYNVSEKSKTFSVRKDLDIFGNDFHVVIAEGPIDLMQIEHLFYDEDTLTNPHYISGSVNGNTFTHAINEFLALGLFPATFDIYIDNEYKSIENITKELKRLRVFNSSYYKFNVYLNNHPKYQKQKKQDFGVPVDQIKRVKVNI